MLYVVKQDEFWNDLAVNVDYLSHISNAILSLEGDDKTIADGVECMSVITKTFKEKSEMPNAIEDVIQAF